MEQILMQNSIVKFFVKKSVKAIARIFTFFVPQIKDVILFQSSNPLNYNENVKYLFEYLSINSDLKCIWVTSSQVLKQHLESRNLKAVIHPSLESIYFYLRCSISISGETKPPNGYGFINPKAIKISLSHGFGPRSTNSADGNIFKTNLDVVNALNQFDLMGFSSDYTRMLIGKGLFLLPESKSIKMGLPRCDQLLDKKNVTTLKINRPISSEIFNEVRIDSTLYLYAPTWRVNGRLNFPLINENIDCLNRLEEILVSNNSFLLISAHQLNPFDVDISKFKNIKLFAETYFYDVNQLLPEIDILISDYSSIITEFSLLNREIVFHLPDYDYYFEYGLNEDFINNLPGMEIQNLEDLFKIIKSRKTNQSDMILRNYKNYKSKFYDVDITNSRSLYLQLINKLLKNK